MKLEYLNKHHLIRQMASTDRLSTLAERVHDLLKASFPSRYTSRRREHYILLLINIFSQSTHYSSIYQSRDLGGSGENLHVVLCVSVISLPDRVA